MFSVGVDDLSVAVLEEDDTDNLVWSWCYPSFSDDKKDYCLEKYRLFSTLTPDQSTDSPVGGKIDENGLKSHLNTDWFYFCIRKVHTQSLAQVRSVMVVMSCKIYHPSLFSTLSNLLAHLYIRTGSPLQLLEHLLSVMTSGRCGVGSNGIFSITDFHVGSFTQHVAILGQYVKDLIRRFDKEVILIYTAMLLRKRVVVYDRDIQRLINITTCLPLLVHHRMSWEMVYPITSPTHMSSLMSPHYVAGVCDISHSPPWDVYVNYPDQEITLSPPGKESLTLTKIHKDIAMTLVSVACDVDLSCEQMIKKIDEKTGDVVQIIRSLSPDASGIISMDILRNRKLSDANFTFLSQLALIEGLIR